MGQLTTHILDLVAGRPAAGVRVELFAIEGGSRKLLTTAITNQDGRCDDPLLAGDNFRRGSYELVFHIGDFYASSGNENLGLPFLDLVPVRFSVTEADDHYHVPLLVSAYGYSTYRGS